jgi:CHASE2 domain-containing sensor protein
MGYVGWLDKFETAGLDVFTLLQPSRQPDKVMVVGINDDDYRERFSETSPLNYCKLEEVISAIAASKPRVIGVDIDTSAASFRKLQIEKGWPQVVWAEDAIQTGKILEVVPALGGIGRDSAQLGLALLLSDSDGVIRRYRRRFSVQGGYADSFPWAVVNAYCSKGVEPRCRALKSAESDGSEGELLLNFAGERFDFRPLAVREIMKVSAEPGWAERGLFKDKVVLLGGSFHAARDTHTTPIGEMFGVQIMAQAIESDLDEGGIRRLNEWKAIFFDLLAGMLVVYIQFRFHRNLMMGLALSLLAIPIVAVTGSYLAFSTAARWFNFIPVLIGVLIHELYDRAREYKQLWERSRNVERASEE